MPPYLEDVLNPLEFFYCDGDGNYIPLNQISNVTLCDDVECVPYCTATCLNEIGEMSLTGMLTHRSYRRFWKSIHSWNNHTCRKKRTAARQKEKIRRDKLKNGCRGGDVMCQKQRN